VNTTRGRLDEPVARTLDQELSLVRDAIRLVASGGTNRVTLAGLRFGEELIEPNRRMARDAGIRIRPLWGTGDESVDLVVERDDDA
jgi:hypothetical protein